MRVEDGKDFYEKVEIPAELGDAVNKAIASCDKEKLREKYCRAQKKENAVRIFRYAASAAAGLLVCLTVGVNSSQVFAKEMSEVPVIGALARVLTVRSWHENEGDYEIDVEVPQIAAGTASGDGSAVAPDGGGADAASEFIGDVNAEIEKIVEEYTQQAQAEFEEYKKAFFENGGSEEEWADRTMDIYVDYEVKYQEGPLLSLELVTSKAWVSAEEERYYYNLNLAQDRSLSLEELLGENYVELCNESIRRQIGERIANDENMVYWGFGEDDGMIEGFETVTEDTRFYLNQEKKVVIVFEKYEIAPGYMGIQEFVIEGEK